MRRDDYLCVIVIYIVCFIKVMQARESATRVEYEVVDKRNVCYPFAVIIVQELNTLL